MRYPGTCFVAVNDRISENNCISVYYGKGWDISSSGVFSIVFTKELETCPILQNPGFFVPSHTGGLTSSYLVRWHPDLLTYWRRPASRTSQFSASWNFGLLISRLDSRPISQYHTDFAFLASSHSSISTRSFPHHLTSIVFNQIKKQ